MSDDNATVKPLDEYAEAAVQRLLTEHAQVAEQGITVVRRDHTLLLRGEVASPQRRDEILRLVTEHFPDVTIACDIGVTRAPEPSEVEELP
ncbi:hypothetical protein SAMN05444365_10156 [Micromonospora pattaloongensis]|uniref:BON domain-containing protein n=1 Tax=Micromonospora pattaloongensis TaxID=405436 RepID=A0A1H3FKV2_9ACTN|nr:hypothetical protein [Micromonospora pattaloongensis]SDX91560.1 hypothetical protein SAMN05444365_10156 [Micromonospora pattaloongensis]